ncbi:uncharacterized protein Bfra_011101 [Botrytis fragariae]|uniref:Uncharacterized protein n=1 Tax=Botrytis fragariae TaxID=1964551 RepID=A0A8H6AL48_9HELO|nr:uncharacterized protein Bfra_011101 [Botrytis fragariae]KAF5869293.1 hypothetical protein Bfra_011101 [Botrytis fragariae]
MPPTNIATEFVNSNKLTAKEFIPFLKKQDATFWNLVSSESTILEAMTSHEVLKDMPPLEGQQLQALFAGLRFSGEEEGLMGFDSKVIAPSAADLPPFLGLQTPETQSRERIINFDPRAIPLSFDDPKSPDRRSQVLDMPVASIDASYSPNGNASFDQGTHQGASNDEPSFIGLCNSISSPPLVGKYSDHTINNDSLFLTLLDQKWERLRLIDPVKAFLFKAMKAKSESVPGDIDAVLPSIQDSDLPLEHIQKLVTVSQISTRAKKDKIGAEIAQKPFLDDFRKQKRVGIKVSQLVDCFSKGILYLYPFFMPEIQKGGKNKTGSKKWSVARLSVLCTLIHSSQSAFEKNLKLLARAFEPFLHELSNDLDVEALLKELDNQDPHPEGLEDSRYQHYSSDNDKMEELFEEFPGTSCFLQGKILCVKAFESHWTTQLAQITTPVGPKATVHITIKVWDSLENDHTSTLDFQRWLTEVVMLEEDPKTVKCSLQKMNSMRQSNLDDCGIIALHNAIATYHGEADTEMFSEEWSRQERYRFCSMFVQHAKKLYRDRRV